MNESTHRRSARRRSRAALASALAAGACLAVAPGAALAAKPITFKYEVTVKKLALAKGNKVKVNGRVTAPEAKVKQWWSRKTVSKVVRKGVNNGYQSPYKSEGYNCSPVVKGEVTRFACALQGADVPTSVTLRFAVVYRGATRSG